MYELRIKKHLIEQVERRMVVDYNQIWILFGVPLGNLNHPVKETQKKDEVAPSVAVPAVDRA
jgi:hypothetical protein